MMYARTCALIVVCLLVSGCSEGGPEIAGVKGKVTMDGKPLANAAVVFVPEKGRPAGARTDAEGNYELTFTEGRKGTMPGVNKVRISTAADPSETPEGKRIPAQPETVPMKYNAQTELTFTVEADKENIANFDLESGGALPAADNLNEPEKKKK
jgi:hypothetical protein